MKVRKASFRRNYPIKSVFIFLFLKCFVIWGFAQDLSTFSLQLSRQKSPFSTASFQRDASFFPVQNTSPIKQLGLPLAQQAYQPVFINPDPGYLSFLCRKELEIERRSPIAFWFQIGENDPAFLRHERGGAVTSIKLKFRFAE